MISTRIRSELTVAKIYAETRFLPVWELQCANHPEAELAAILTGISGHIPAYESNASLWSEIATFSALGVARG